MIMESIKLGTMLKIWIFDVHKRVLAIVWLDYNQKLRRYRITEVRCFVAESKCREIIDSIFRNSACG
ncbi:MAG: hypothetical protein DRJ40_11490 [Thermoprotei archaeon]|nr:MAG: hypothetical protein DRJ40_11490 [Thermoprotei archaeon]